MKKELTIRNICFAIAIPIFMPLSCAVNDSAPDMHWHNYSSRNAGFQADLPCIPEEEEVKVFQREPKLARFYSFSCEREGLKFSVSMSEHIGDFDISNLQEKFDEVEKTLKESVGDGGNITALNMLSNGMTTRLFDVKGENNRFLQMHTQNERGAYNLIMHFKDLVPRFQGKEAFIAKRFFDSLEC